MSSLSFLSLCDQGSRAKRWGWWMCGIVLVLSSVRGWYNLSWQQVSQQQSAIAVAGSQPPSLSPLPLSPHLPPSPSLPLSPPLSTQSVIGEYNNPNGEELVHWIQDHTPQSAVFAGTMPTMATVLLTTGRPVVNHPHYENAGLRCVLKVAVLTSLDHSMLCVC